MSKEWDKIAKYEKAISQKYGEEATEHPQKGWSDEKEKEYREQLNITIRFNKEHYEASLAIYDAQVEDLRKIIAKKPSKISSGLIIGGGFLAGILTSVAIVYAVDGK